MGEEERQEEEQPAPFEIPPEIRKALSGAIKEELTPLVQPTVDKFNTAIDSLNTAVANIPNLVAQQIKEIVPQIQQGIETKMEEMAGGKAPDVNDGGQPRGLNKLLANPQLVDKALDKLLDRFLGGGSEEDALVKAIDKITKYQELGQKMAGMFGYHEAPVDTVLKSFTDGLGKGYTVGIRTKSGHDVPIVERSTLQSNPGGKPKDIKPSKGLRKKIKVDLSQIY